MTNVIVSLGTSYDIGKNSGPTTVEGAEHVLVAVPASAGLVTVGIYKLEQQASYNFRPNEPLQGAVDVEESLAPVASVVLSAGTHIVKKARHHYVRATDANNVWATSVLVAR